MTRYVSNRILFKPLFIGERIGRIFHYTSQSSSRVWCELRASTRLTAMLALFSIASGDDTKLVLSL